MNKITKLKNEINVFYNDIINEFDIPINEKTIYYLYDKLGNEWERCYCILNSLKHDIELLNNMTENDIKNQFGIMSMYERIKYDFEVRKRSYDRMKINL